MTPGGKRKINRKEAEETQRKRRREGKGDGKTVSGMRDGKQSE